MTFRSAIRGYLYPTKNKRSPFNQAVRIVANADANHSEKKRCFVLCALCFVTICEQSAKLKVPSTKHKVQSTKFKVQNSICPSLEKSFRYQQVSLRCNLNIPRAAFHNRHWLSELFH